MLPPSFWSSQLSYYCWQLVGEPDFAPSYLPIAVSGSTEHCTIFHFPSVLRSSVLRHRRDILTFLDILTVYTMKTISFLNAYHPGW